MKEAPSKWIARISSDVSSLALYICKKRLISRACSSTFLLFLILVPSKYIINSFYLVFVPRFHVLSSATLLTARPFWALFLFRASMFYHLLRFCPRAPFEPCFCSARPCFDICNASARAPLFIIQSLIHIFPYFPSLAYLIDYPQNNCHSPLSPSIPSFFLIPT